MLAVDARLSPDGGLTQLGASPFSLPAGAALAGIVVS